MSFELATGPPLLLTGSQLDGLLQPAAGVASGKGLGLVQAHLRQSVALVSGSRRCAAGPTPSAVAPQDRRHPTLRQATPQRLTNLQLLEPAELTWKNCCNQARRNVTKDTRVEGGWRAAAEVT